MARLELRSREPTTSPLQVSIRKITVLRDLLPDFNRVLSVTMRELGTPILPRELSEMAAHVFADRI